jgi:hypothetical protein
MSLSLEIKKSFRIRDAVKKIGTRANSKLKAEFFLNALVEWFQS